MLGCTWFGRRLERSCRENTNHFGSALKKLRATIGSPNQGVGFEWMEWADWQPLFPSISGWAWGNTNGEELGLSSWKCSVIKELPCGFDAFLNYDLQNSITQRYKETLLVLTYWSASASISSTKTKPFLDVLFLILLYGLKSKSTSFRANNCQMYNGSLETKFNQQFQRMLTIYRGSHNF